MQQQKKRLLAVSLVGILLGFLIIIQWRSFTKLSAQERDTSRNIFREIQILKATNQSLQEEVIALNKTLENASNQASVLKSIEEEILRYQMLAGEVTVFGPGISIEIKQNIDAIWLIDMTNELFDAGAEAVSVNGIRLTDKTNGFEILPQGQIYLYADTLKAPYTFKAIGEKSELRNIVNQTGGIIERLLSTTPDLEIVIQDLDRIEMVKI